jgi:hypothetical protein
LTEFEHWRKYVFGVKDKMKYTVRYAHLENKPKWKVGDILRRGDIVGIMGTTGQSTAIHLHIDCVEGEQKKPYKLVDLSNGNKTSSSHELFFFIDSELFGVPPVITTQYDDPEYLITYGKLHRGYDVVPKDRKETKEHYAIHWNRSRIGIVSLVVDDPKGYGNCIYITFEI